MLTALARAISDLSLPAVRRVAALGVLLAAASFAVLWIGIALLLARTSFFEWGPLNWLVDALGALAVLFLSWLLFPAVVTLVMGLFLDRVAGAVEREHYPDRGPPRRTSLAQTLATTLRLMGVALLLNLLALPVYLLLPGFNLLVFFGLNGYLFGREYFEVVALRRLASADARALRRRCAGRVFGAGAVIAGLFAIPIVNLIAPIIATAFMLHVVERMPAPDGRRFLAR